MNSSPEIVQDSYSRRTLAELYLYFLTEKYGVSFDFDSELAGSILGKIKFTPLTIQVTSHLRKDLPRWRFTLAHEIGHLILHLPLLIHKLSEKTDNDTTLSFQYFGVGETNRRLEYQANLFAANLLLPSSTFEDFVLRYFQQENIHKRHLYWDHQPVNQQLVLHLLTAISHTYGISFEVGRIRLVTLGLLIDDRFKKVRDVLKEMQLL